VETNDDGRTQIKTVLFVRRWDCRNKRHNPEGSVLGMGKILTNIFETTYCRIYNVDNSVKTNVPGFRDYIFL
jgi:hypothetical protein